MDNFDLKNYLYNNTLLTESKEKEVISEENTSVEKDVKEMKDDSSKKMTVKELKSKIREDILGELKKESDDPAVGDYEEAHTGVEESSKIKEQEDEEVDMEVDMDVDAEMKDSAEEEDVFNTEDRVENAEKEAYEGIIKAGRAYKALGENPNSGGMKTMMDQLAYLERTYNFPPKEDLFENKK